MANENVNKVVLGNEVLLDLTGDTATESDVVSGKTFHKASGALGTGTAVIPGPSSTTPAMDGTASVGSESNYARGDHVHPKDTSKVSVQNYADRTTTRIENEQGYVHSYSQKSNSGGKSEEYIQSHQILMNSNDESNKFSSVRIQPDNIELKTFNTTSGNTNEVVMTPAATSFSKPLRVIDINSETDIFKEVISDVTKADILVIKSDLTDNDSITLWLKYLVIAICAKYPNRTYTLFKGKLDLPNVGYYEVFVDNTSDLADNDVPLCSHGTWKQYDTTFIKFYSNSQGVFVTIDVNNNTNYVSKAGDVMDGTLRIRAADSNTHIRVQANSITRNTAPSADTIGSGIRFCDSQNAWIGRTTSRMRADGSEGIRTETYRHVGSTDIYNALELLIDASGNRQVFVSAKDPWLSALGFDITSASVSCTIDTVTGSFTIRKYGRICNFYAPFGTGTKFTNFTSGSSIGTMPAAFRPVANQSIQGHARTVGSWATATYYPASLTIQTGGSIILNGNQTNIRNCQYVVFQGAYISAS